jgi:hypothetical protein
VGLRAGLDTEARGKILCLCRGSNPGRPVYILTELPQLLCSCPPTTDKLHNVALTYTAGVEAVARHPQ